MTFSASHSSRSNSKPSKRGSFSIKSKAIQLYVEIPDTMPPKPEDVLKYAERLGVNPNKEAYLMYLVHEGLRAPLPYPWIPCFEPHKEDVYYHNTVTTESQWLHPMDQVYKQKVIEARADHNLKAIQNLENSKMKPTFKGLPPLKRMDFGGSQLTPHVQARPFDPMNNARSAGTGVNRLAPLVPLSTPKPGGIGFLNPSVGRLQPMVPIPVASGSNNKQGNPTRPNTREEHHWAPSNDSSNKQDSSSVSNSEGSEFMKPKILGPGGAESTPGLSSRSSARARNLREFTSRHMFASPHNLARNLDTLQMDTSGDIPNGGSRPKAKGNVRFNLDEDPELKFDNSSKASDNFKPQRDQKSDEDSDGSTGVDSGSEEDDTESEPSNHFRNPNAPLDQVNHLLAKANKLRYGGPPKKTSSRPSISTKPEIGGSSGPKRISPPTLKPFPDSNVMENSNKPFFKQVPKYQSNFAGDSGEKMIAFPLEMGNHNKSSLRLEMENQLQKFQVELDKERDEREQQMKKNLEKTLNFYKMDSEERLKKIKQDLETNQAEKVDKLKSEQEARLNSEVKKITEEYSEKIKKKRNEIEERNEKALQEIAVEGLSSEQAALVEAKRKEALTSLEKEAQEDLNETKAGVKRDHEKRIEQMRAYQKTFMETLQAEFKHAEDKARREQETTLFELHRSFDEEKAKLMETCRAEQDADLQKLNQLYANRREMLTTELKAAEKALKDRLKACAKEQESLANLQNNQLNISNTTSGKAGKQPELESREKQIENLKSKYKKLQEKYIALKQDLSSVVTSEQIRVFDEAKPSRTHDSVEISLQNGHDDSDTDEETGASTEISKALDSRNDFKVDDMIDGSNNRLNQALAALEVLRGQILDMSAGVVNQQKDKESTPRKHGSKDNLLRRKSASQTRLNVYPTKKPNETYNMIPLRLRPSRSATQVEGSPAQNGTHNYHAQGVGEHEHQIVQEAKDFIRAQKQRLSLGAKPGITLNAGVQQQRRIADLIKESVTAVSEQVRSRNKSPNKKDLYSETESSGVGSLKSHLNSDKSQVAKDIDGILVSLKKLDHQMKHLWSMVGQEKSGFPNGNQGMEPDFLDNSRRGLLTPLIHPMSPGALAQLSLMSKGGVTDSPINSLHSSISPSDLMASRYSMGPEFTNSGQPNKLFSNITPSTLLMPQLNEHVQSMKNRRDQIMKEHFTQSLNSAVGNDLPESLLEKTKDLREWLEKF